MHNSKNVRDLHNSLVSMLPRVKNIDEVVEATKKLLTLPDGREGQQFLGRILATMNEQNAPFVYRWALNVQDQILDYPPFSREHDVRACWFYPQLRQWVRNKGWKFTRAWEFENGNGLVHLQVSIQRHSPKIVLRHESKAHGRWERIRNGEQVLIRDSMMDVPVFNNGHIHIYAQEFHPDAPPSTRMRDYPQSIGGGELIG